MPVPIPLSLVCDRLMRQPSRILEDEGTWRHAAVATVFREGEHGAELLLIQRADHEEDPWSGQIGFPGGRQEDQDPDRESTATRETLEEIGLDLTDGSAERLGALDQLQARARRKILPMSITPFAYVLPDATPCFVLNHEVAEVFWTPLSTLADPARRIWFDAERSDIPYLFHALDVDRGPSVLWGLTHRMVFEILGRLGLIDDVDALTLPKHTG